jgi:phage tail sheath gpL-like
MSIIILGFASTDKVPGFYAETVFGAGGISFGSQPLYLLLTGNMLTGGLSTPDASIDDISSEADAKLNYFPGSELHRMCRAALRVPGIRIKAAPVAEASSSPAVATATLTVAGTWSTVGNFRVRVAGVAYQGGIGASDSVTAVALNISNQVNGDASATVIAIPVAGVITFSSKQKGTRNNRLVLWYDKSVLPAGITFTPAGGATVATNGVYFLTGAGSDSVANVLTNIYPGRYHRHATAEADATNAALWKTHINAKAGVLEGRMEHVVMASNDTQNNAKSVAQVTLNDQRFEMLWLLNGDTPPWEMSAAFAAIRVQAEQSQPNSGYDGVVVPGVSAQLAQGDWANRATQVSCLDNSLTPLLSQPDGSVTCVRAITTHSLNGSNPDFTCLDTAQSVVPDAFRDVLRLTWGSPQIPGSFSEANRYVRSEPSAGEPTPPAGVAYPSLWGGEMTNQLRIAEKALWVTQVSLNLPGVDYDSTAQRIMAICPVVVLPLNHQVGVSVRQTNPN